MNSSVAAPYQRDGFTAAVVKNVIVTSLCLLINSINGTLLHTFRRHQVLNSNPRYILFIHLVINDMTQLALSTLLHVLVYAVYTLPVPACALLVLVAATATFNTPLNLACMAVECYVAVCVPLRHPQICTVRRTYVLIGLIWAASTLSVVPDLLVLLATEPPAFLRARVRCARDYVFRNPHSVQKRDVSHLLCLLLVWLTLLYTYFRILFAARSARADCRKARGTIVLHAFQLALCMLTYVRPMLEQGLLLLLPHHYPAIRFCSYLLVQIVPRLVSPVVYGLRDHTFRHHVSRYLLCRLQVGSEARAVRPGQAGPGRQAGPGSEARAVRPGQ